jgi:hypothetical protein
MERFFAAPQRGVVGALPTTSGRQRPGHWRLLALAKPRLPEPGGAARRPGKRGRAIGLTRFAATIVVKRA